MLRTGFYLLGFFKKHAILLAQQNVVIGYISFPSIQKKELQTVS